MSCCPNRVASLVAMTLMVAGIIAIQKPATSTAPVAVQETEAAQDEAFAAIDNMHHFMEYISQPSYRALKDGLATEPADRAAWRPLKSHALILAETSAIVSRRTPEKATDEEIAQWQQISLDVYNSGKELYQSLGDYEKAKVNFDKMIDNCNHCHDVFENGKHQLEK